MIENLNTTVIMLLDLNKCHLLNFNAIYFKICLDVNWWIKKFKWILANKSIHETDFTILQALLLNYSSKYTKDPVPLINFIYDWKTIHVYIICNIIHNIYVYINIFSILYNIRQHHLVQYNMLYKIVYSIYDL